MYNLKVVFKNNSSSDATLKKYDNSNETVTESVVPKSSLVNLIDQLIDIELSKKSNRFYILLDPESKDLAILEIPLTIDERLISSFSESTFIETVIISSSLSELSKFSYFDVSLTSPSQDEVINTISNG